MSIESHFKTLTMFRCPYYTDRPNPVHQLIIRFFTTDPAKYSHTHNIPDSLNTLRRGDLCGTYSGFLSEIYYPTGKKIAER